MSPFISRPADPTCWQNNHLRVFISHLASEKRYAVALKEALDWYEISGFVAHQSISPTSEWLSEINQALLTCDALVALLHKGFHLSSWTDQEIGYVMGRKRPVCAVLLGEQPYGFIGHRQAIHGRSKDVSEIAAELFRAYCQNRTTAKRMGEVAVKHFESSNTYAHADERLGHLEALAFWDHSFSERIAEAAEINSQIFGAGRHDVPNRVNKLLDVRSKHPRKST